MNQFWYLPDALASLRRVFSPRSLESALGRPHIELVQQIQSRCSGPLEFEDERDVEHLQCCLGPAVTQWRHAVNVECHALTFDDRRDPTCSSCVSSIRDHFVQQLSRFPLARHRHKCHEQNTTPRNWTKWAQHQTIVCTWCLNSTSRDVTLPRERDFVWFLTWFWLAEI